MVNGKCEIEVTCSKRPFQTVTKTWAAIGFEWFGANNPVLPDLLAQMREKKDAVYEDRDGVVYVFTPKGPIDV